MAFLSTGSIACHARCFDHRSFACLYRPTASLILALYLSPAQGGGPKRLRLQRVAGCLKLAARALFSLRPAPWQSFAPLDSHPFGRASWDVKSHRYRLFLEDPSVKSLDPGTEQQHMQFIPNAAAVASINQVKEAGYCLQQAPGGNKRNLA